ENANDTSCQPIVANIAPHIAFLNRIFLFGANLYNASKTIKNTTEEMIHLSVFHTLIKLSDNPNIEKTYTPIIFPKIGNRNAIQMPTIIAIVNAIAINRATINVRSSSTSYAWLNAFVRAFTPFEADHKVPRKPIDNTPPFCALTN